MAATNFIVLCILFGVGFTAAAPCNDTTCLYQTKQWGDPNPNLFHFCNPATNTSVELPCPSGRGFIDNGTYTGCVPFSEWPSQCITQVEAAPNCTCGNVLNTWPATNPNEFYLCPADGALAALLPCETGKGFVSNDNFQGCLDWAEWRASRCCYTY